MRLRLDIAYDGVGFAGWARQPGQRTVQECLAVALRHVLRSNAELALTGAGRTDAGVHARGQVAHVDVDPAGIDPVLVQQADVLDTATVLRRLRGALPDDVSVTAVAIAPEDFDARFSALARRYSYTVCDNVTGPDPLDRGHVLHHPRPLDHERMNTAGARLLGEHDFAAFCRTRPDGTTVRRLLALRWAREEYLVLTVRADAFCHSMVRALVGGLLPVGDGRRPVDWPAQVLASRQRHPAAVVAPAHPLVLEEVEYPPAELLLERQRTTRAVRTHQP